MSLWELVAMATAALVAAALIWAAASLMRSRQAVVFVEVGDDETRVFGENRELLTTVKNVVAVQTDGRTLEPVSFGEAATHERAEGTEVIELSTGTSPGGHLWQPFMGYVLLSSIEQHGKRVWGLNAKIRVNLSRDATRAAFLEAVTPKSMKALGTIELV